VRDPDFSVAIVGKPTVNHALQVHDAPIIQSTKSSTRGLHHMVVSLQHAKRFILVLASVGLLAGSAAPFATAQAKGPTNDGTCEQWQAWYNSDLDEAFAAAAGGRPDLMVQYSNDAKYDLQLAQQAGCSWASGVVQRKPSSAGVASPISSTRAV
jgi:hypothetical protein